MKKGWFGPSSKGTSSDGKDLVWVAKAELTGEGKMPVQVSGKAGGLSGTSTDELVVRRVDDFDRSTHTIVTRIASRSTGLGAPEPIVGKYDMEIKKGRVICTVKIRAEPYDGPYIEPFKLKDQEVRFGNILRPGVKTGSSVDPETKLKLKGDIEKYLNAHKFQLHRARCARGDKCDCKIETACCKLGVDFNISLVDSGEHHLIGFHINDNQEEIVRIDAQGQAWSRPLGRAHMHAWYTPSSRDQTYAHETGHLMGWPDEYKGGSIAADTKRWKEERSDALMMNGGDIPPEYLWDIRDWVLNKTGDEWKIIPI